MTHLTDRRSNPFGLTPPFDRSDESAVPAVFGYGDPNADFHVIGDRPGVHGGSTSGIPFALGRRETPLTSLLRSVDFLSDDADGPHLDDCFLSYIHMCTLPAGTEPTADSYARLERFFDAELRAVNAHVLVPIGRRATARVVESYTTRRTRIELDMDALHATEIRGRGFLVVPLADPDRWDESLVARASDRFESILSSDYRQTKGVATTVG
ncbi:uracil-DNA glycosylase family protein [Halovivax cerinus]|uniref:Uracil-DNA glycosylase family protein n=1 Tax=Halovivax cerinus TaxID=1487865 RepID=A0ABD5NS71_9EURY|nr:uracil-DNA glycosylase family protein [Halovivax cerinus]